MKDIHGGVLQRTGGSLIGNAPEHDVIQQRDLFSQLHGRERLKTLRLGVLRLQGNTLGLRTDRRPERTVVSEHNTRRGRLQMKSALTTMKCSRGELFWREMISVALKLAL